MNQFTPWSKVALLALRIAVGWHFLYEGVYKIQSETGSAVYSTARYTLQSSTGRLRNYFTQSEPGSVQRDVALSRVDAWHDEIVKSFAAQKALGEDQKARLAALRDQVKLNALSALAGETPFEDVVNFDWTYVHQETLNIPPPPEAERFSALTYLQGSAGPLRSVFRAMVPDMDGLERLTARRAQALLDERYTEVLRHYAAAGLPFTAEQQARLAQVRDALKAAIAEALNSGPFRARLADYRNLRERVERDASRLHAPFTRERLDADRKSLDGAAAEMLAVVNEPLSELAVQTHTIATVAQLAAGPLPRPGSSALWVDTAIKVSLTAIGLCLILGLFTPAAALAAAGQLATFYFASPPWPGMPAASLGGHYLYIDRNLIEMIAAFVIAASGTGRWAGLDAYAAPLMARWKQRTRPVEETIPVHA